MEYRPDMSVSLPCSYDSWCNDSWCTTTDASPRRDHGVVLGRRRPPPPPPNGAPIASVVAPIDLRPSKLDHSPLFRQAASDCMTRSLVQLFCVRELILVFRFSFMGVRKSQSWVVRFPV